MANHIIGLTIGEVKIRDKDGQLWTTNTTYDKYDRPQYTKKEKCND